MFHWVLGDRVSTDNFSASPPPVHITSAWRSAMIETDGMRRIYRRAGVGGMSHAAERVIRLRWTTPNRQREKARSGQGQGWVHFRFQNFWKVSKWKTVACYAYQKTMRAMVFDRRCCSGRRQVSFAIPHPSYHQCRRRHHHHHHHPCHVLFSAKQPDVFCQVLVASLPWVSHCTGLLSRWDQLDGFVFSSDYIFPTTSGFQLGVF